MKEFKRSTKISSCRRYNNSVAGHEEDDSKNIRVSWRTGNTIARSIMAIFFLFGTFSLKLNAQAFNIDQVRNGSAASPTDPGDWVNGNLTPTQAHFVEGYSVPYRAVATGLTAGTAITLRIGFDTKDGGKNALDYLTYYDRLTAPGIEHTVIFGHPAETIDPLIGVSGVSGTTDQIAITAPASIVLASNLPAGSSQPLTSFNALPAAERVMSIFGGTFVDGSFHYVSQDPITATDDHAQTVIEVTFIPDGATAVLAWGGHIASRLDWGYTDGVPNSAGGISGSPYHMRLINYIIGGVTTSLGNQDRSLKASAVAAPPPVCQLLPALHEVCVGTNVDFLASATSGTPPYTFTWYKDENYASSIATGNTLTLNNVQLTDAAMYDMIVVDALGLKDTCHAQLIVHGPPSCNIGTPGPGDLICNHGNYTIGTTLSTSQYHFHWTMSVDGSPSGWAIVGSDTLQTITFSAGNCGSFGFQVHFTLEVTDRATGCTSSCNAAFGPRAPQCAVDIRPPVVLTCSTTSQYLLASYLTDIINPTLLWTRNGNSLGAGISDSVSLDSIQITQAGTYRFTVTDPANSSNVCFSEVTVTQDTATPHLSATHDNVSCNGLSNGAINLSVSGGTGPFTYLWSNSATTEDISGLSAGTYSVVVTGSNGCSANLSVIISEPAALQIIETHTAVACNGDNSGAINITVSGGTTPYSYLWSNSATTEDISGLAAGTYSVMVTDAHGCKDSISVNIGEPNALNIIETHTAVACNGDNSGSINITVSGGTTPYSYLWSNGATTEDISGLVADSYSVMVTDAHGCKDSITVPIFEPNALEVIETHTAVACNGDNSGAINITVSEGTAPYSYLWSNGATTEDISGLAAGTYSVMVTDAHGCKDSISVIISQPNALSIIETHTAVACNGDNSGAINITVSGGTTPYSYLWSNSATTQDISGLAAGTYSVMVTDAHGCKDSISVTISQPNALGIIESHVDVACNGNSSGSINITVSGGTTPYSYLWSNSATTQDISGLAAGTYSVMVTDAHGCKDSISVTISQPDALVITEDHDDALCFGTSTGAIDITVSGGTTPYSYLWSNSATTQDISGLAAGTYSVMVTDAHGCKDSISITISQPADVSCVLQAPSTLPPCGSQNNSLSSTVNNATSYVWSVSGTGWSITGGQGTSSIMYTAGSGEATFKLIVGNANGCLDSCMVTFECIQQNEFCSLTQGFYGSGKGVACATGERGNDLLTRLLGAPFGNLYIGKPGRSLTITQSDVVCVMMRLPAGGKAAMLPVGNQTFGANCVTTIPINKNGRFDNVLLGQTITLGLNMRMDEDLGSLVLAGTVMTTIESNPGADGKCGTEDDIPINTSLTVRFIPQSVLNALNTLYGSATVANLFDLANRALGGQSTGGATLSEINTAVSAINEGFDHCKFLQGFTSPKVGAEQMDITITETNEVSHFAYPNPFGVSTTIEFVSKTDAAVTVEVYNMEGQRVAALFKGDVVAGETRRVVFTGDNLPNGIYFYKIYTGGYVYTSKLMLMK